MYYFFTIRKPETANKLCNLIKFKYKLLKLTTINYLEA